MRIRVMKMQTCMMPESVFERGQDVKAHLEALDETCRILHGLKLCSRYCAACTIACNIAEIALPMNEKTEIMEHSLVTMRRR